jgi:hypothetical protein
MLTFNPFYKSAEKAFTHESFAEAAYFKWQQNSLYYFQFK